MGWFQVKKEVWSEMRNVNMVGMLLFSSLMAFAAAADGVWSTSLFEAMRDESAKENKANPWVDAHGASWGFYYNGTATAPGTCAEWNTDSPMVGFKSTSAGSYATLQANVAAYSTGGAQGGDKVSPGECYIHPYKGSSYEYIRYTANEAGVYSVTGVVRCLNGSSNGVKVDVIADGKVVVTATTTNDKAEIPFAAHNVRLWKGETVDLRFDSNGNVGYDATGLRLVVARTGDIRPPITISLADALVDAAGGDGIVNPCAESSLGKPGTWTFLRREGAVDTVLGNEWKHAKADNSKFFGFKNPDGYPKLMLNAGTSSTSGEDGGSVPSGAIYYHPERSGSNKLILRYTAAETGFYSFEAFCRSLNSGTAFNGVKIAVCARFGTVEQELAQGVTTTSDGQTLTGTHIALSAGESLEVLVDSNGDYAFDASLLGFTVTFEETSEGFDRTLVANTFLDNLRSGNPTAADYVDEKGGKWSYGRYSAMDNPGSFAAYGNYVESGDFLGFNGGYPISSVNYGYIVMNTQNVTATYNGLSIAAGNITLHPLHNQIPTIRYVVPASGIYSYVANLTHLNAAGDGVDGVVVVGGTGYVGYARASAVKSSDLPSQVEINGEGLWLKAGETLDFALGNGGNGNYQFDASMMNGIILREAALPAKLCANFDICGTSRSPYSGVGRVGLPGGGDWTAVLPGSKRSVFGYVAGERREVKLILSRAAGSVTLANVPSVISDGVESAGASDPVSFTVTGLVANAEYTFYAYSRNASGENGVFTVDGTDHVADQTWFRPTGGDYCTFTATADAAGTVSGTFAGTDNGAATFCALQILGEAFPVRLPRGMTLSFR